MDREPRPLPGPSRPPDFDDYPLEALFVYEINPMMLSRGLPILVPQGIR